MKKFGILVFFSLLNLTLTYANYHDQVVEIIKQVPTNNLSLEQIILLESLDDIDSNIGYGLCISAGTHYLSCDPKGTLGYGLCISSGTHYINCDPKGTLGYGLCISSGTHYSNCDPKGTLGYGLCISSGTHYSDCDPQ